MDLDGISERAGLKALKTFGKYAQELNRPWGRKRATKEVQMARYEREHRGRPLAIRKFMLQQGISEDQMDGKIKKYIKEMENAANRT